MMGEAAEHDVWHALANPTRRAILDRLQGGPLTTGELSETFPDLSRYAVMQHLEVLVGAGLVLHRYEGRFRQNYLNPVPLQRAYDRWLRGHMADAGRAVAALQRHFEVGEYEERNMEKTDHRLVRIEAEVEIGAEPARVFEALTTGLDAWWPLRSLAGAPVVHEARPGGRVYEDWGEGKGVLYGIITVCDPPSRVILVGQGGLGDGAYTSKNIDVIEPSAAGAVYKKSLLLWGVIPQETERVFQTGTRKLGAALKEFLEGNQSTSEG